VEAAAFVELSSRPKRNMDVKVPIYACTVKSEVECAELGIDVQIHDHSHGTRIEVRHGRPAAVSALHMGGQMLHACVNFLKFIKYQEPRQGCADQVPLIHRKSSDISLYIQ
jgi:hypothetical protein